MSVRVTGTKPADLEGRQALLLEGKLQGVNGTIESRHQFIEENGYEIAGVHEEEYLTSPDAKVIRTIIRYPVKKKS